MHVFLDSQLAKISHDLNNPNGPKTHVVKPVDGYPAEHAHVKNTICGVKYNAGSHNMTRHSPDERASGDPLPASGKWSQKGAASATDSSCQTLDGGGMYYAYQFPGI